MEKVLAGLQEKYYIDIEDINIRESRKNREMARKYKLQYTPLLVFFDENGEYIWHKEGSMSEKDIVRSFSRRKVNLEAK